MFEFQECCDAVHFRTIGLVCREQGLEHCWNSLRPVGAVFLNAILYPFGLAPLNHILLLLYSAFVMSLFLKYRSISPIATSTTNETNWHLYARLLLNIMVLFTLLQFLFAGLASVNLTDVSAGVFAALAIIFFFKRNAPLFAAAAGICVLIRAAYLYPMVLVGMFFFCEFIYKREYKSALLVVPFFLIISVQFVLTYQATGSLSFISPDQSNFWRNIHLESTLSGYDTLVNPIAPHHWPSDATIGMRSALEAYRFDQMTTLLIERLYFYFGSYTPFGQVYLNSYTQRIYNPVFIIIHFFLFVAAYLYTKKLGSPWRIWIPLVIYLGQMLVIIPEQRFVFVIQLILITFAYLFLLNFSPKQTKTTQPTTLC